MSERRDPADDEALRREIQTAIAAGREVGPEMDTHLADSVLARYREDQRARNQASNQAVVPQPTPQSPARPMDGEMFARMVITVVGIAAIVAIILTNPHLWWLIFVAPGLFGVWGWNRHGYDRHARRSRRYSSRDDERRSLPDGQGREEV